ncbi:HAD domain-containing protein [Comamonas sp. Z1]|uniref:HAD domain-containing protein n=1 Tax=Comamonas sp. Z1 TaxID=2601246 RepID=UPI001652CF98
MLHPEAVWRAPRKGIYLALGLENHHLFENANVLVDLMEPYPDVLIVLSTSWVRVLGFTAAASYLPRSLQDRAIGATFHTGMQRDWFTSSPRVHQVLGDVGRRQPSAWVAIDDDAADWPPHTAANFVASDPTYGLSAPQVYLELQQKLEA